MVYKILSLITSAGLLYVSCGKENDSLCTAKPKEDCVCTQQYEPVCGCDEKVYGNECEAACNNIGVLYRGECGKNPLLGNWNFLGYLDADKVNLSNPVKKIPFDNVHIMFNNISSTNNKYTLTGRSSINFIGGEYFIRAEYKAETDNNLTMDSFFWTKIGGSLEALKFEQSFIENLRSSTSYKVTRDILTIKLWKEGSIAEEMVFQKSN
jgi:heat shock protein HslJ